MVKKLAAFLIIAVIFFFMGRVLYQNWKVIPFYEIRFNYALLILSFLLLFLGFFGGCFIWKLTLRYLGESISYRNSLEVIAGSILGKYVPGKLWFTLGRVYLGRKIGLSEKKVVVSIVVEMILMFLSCLLISLISLGFSMKFYSETQIYIAIFAAIIGIVVIHPNILGRMINFVLLRFKKRPIKFELRYIETLGLLGLWCLVWSLMGTGFYFLILSFYPIDLSSFPGMIGTYTIAWIIGFLSIITPAGLGVREGVLSYLLNFYLPVSIGIIVSLLARVWVTIAELIFFAIFAKSLKKHVLR